MKKMVKKERINIYIDPRHYKRLQKSAKYMRKSTSWLINEIFEQWFDR